jgi:hypothetical protein
VVVHGKALEFTSDMVRSAGVQVPVWLIASRGRLHSNNTGRRDIILIKLVRAYIGGVTKFHTDLAHGMVLAAVLIRWHRTAEVGGVGEATAGARRWRTMARATTVTRVGSTALRKWGATPPSCGISKDLGAIAATRLLVDTKLVAEHLRVQL